MFDDMAMEGPVAWIVRDEGDIQRLFLEQQGRIGPVGEDLPFVGTHRFEG